MNEVLNLPIEDPASYHLDLHRYWLSKRGPRPMPARGDIDPTDIPRLLPYLCIVEKVDEEFRYRLVGTAVAQQFGRDFTGKPLGSPINDKPETLRAMRTIVEHIFATGNSVFVTGQYETKFKTIHNVSALGLPLSGDGTHVDMFISTRIARFSWGVRSAADWLRGAPLTTQWTNIHDAIDLERCCLDWERLCDPPASAVGQRHT